MPDRIGSWEAGDEFSCGHHSRRPDRRPVRLDLRRLRAGHARSGPGDVLDLFTEDAFGGRIRSSDDLPSRTIKYPFINPQTGPFYVEGAEPGDTLAIHLIDVQPARDWAVSTTVPLFGALTGTKYTATLQPALPERTWLYAWTGRPRGHLPGARLGLSGPAAARALPRHDRRRPGRRARPATCSCPEAFGGNMDTPEARAGTTIYLGVNVEGALFSIGDGHYTMGEGEVCGVAVEGAMDTRPDRRGHQGRLLRVAASRGRRLDHGRRLVPAAGGRVPHRPHPADPLDLRRDGPVR